MKVFRINDYEWYMAPTLQEAIQKSISDTRLPEDEATDDPREITEEALNDLIFVDNDGNKRTFAEELQRRVALGRQTEIFASSEY